MLLNEKLTKIMQEYFGRKKWYVARGFKDLEKKKEIDLVVDENKFKELKKQGKIKKDLIIYHKKRFIHLDLYVGGQDWHNVKYLHFDKKFRTLRDGLNIPSKEWYLAGIILHSIIDKKYFKLEYRRDIKEADEKTLEKAIKLIEETFGEEIALEIKNYLKNNNFGNIMRIRNKLLIKLFLKNPLAVILDFMQIYWKRIFKYKKGLIIAFIGPDGAGKTTIIKNTKKILNKHNVKVKIVRLGIYNDRTIFLRSIEKVISIFRRKRQGKTKAETFKINKLKLDSKIKNLFRYIDIWIRYLKAIFYKYLGYVVLTDRYFYDLQIYSNFKFLIPKPDDLFIVLAKEDILYKRKQEYEKEELKKILKKFKKFAKENNKEIIDTTKIPPRLAADLVIYYLTKNRKFVSYILNE